MDTFTVLLVRPEYVTTDDDDTYLWSGPAGSPALAVAAARFYACDADEVDQADAADYAVLIVLAGTHQDLNPERN